MDIHNKYTSTKHNLYTIHTYDTIHCSIHMCTPLGWSALASCKFQLRSAFIFQWFRQWLCISTCWQILASFPLNCKPLWFVPFFFFFFGFPKKKTPSSVCPLFHPMPWALKGSNWHAQDKDTDDYLQEFFQQQCRSEWLSRDSKTLGGGLQGAEWPAKLPSRPASLHQQLPGQELSHPPPGSAAPPSMHATGCGDG